jgi:UDP-glucose 4-epimerase
MEILVTGGAGYIGSHTCVELLLAGYEIIVIDNFSTSQLESIARIKEITGKDFHSYKIDLLQQKSIEDVFSRHTIDAVIHFAAAKAVGESVVIPLHYYQTNITGLLNLCQVMNSYGVKNLVFSSSAAVYGKPERVPIPESSPLKPTSPYGKTKAMGEEILRDLYFSDPSWSISLLRYFNPIGAHKSGKIGDAPNGTPSNLMPYLTQVAMGRLKELLIYGNDYATKDGTGVRDYIHVMDLASGHVKALEKVMLSTGVEAYNLGTGKGLSVLEIINAFESAIGIKLPFSFSERRPGDVDFCYADPTKANNELGWVAKRGIDEMCRDSWRWQSLNPAGYL